MPIGNTISLAWYLTNQIFISLLNKFTGINNCIMHFLLLRMLCFYNENFAFNVSLILTVNFPVLEVSCSLVLAVRPKR